MRFVYSAAFLAVMLPSATWSQVVVSQPTSSATGKVLAPAKRGSSTPSSKNGVYEIAEVLRWAMPDSSSLPPQLPGLQDYNRFKGAVSSIQVSDGLLGGYEGTVVLGVNGKRAIPDNIQDEYAWRVAIFGPQAGASGVDFSPRRAGTPDLRSIGPAYLRGRGFDLLTLGCFSEGRTETNASGLYLARAAGKDPTLLVIQVGTGSAGTSVSYRLYFGPVNWKDLPGTRPDYEGELQPFGSCPYKSLQ